MSKTRSVLGKGLSALIPGASEEDARYSGIELADSPTDRREHTPRIAEIEIARVAPAFYDAGGPYFEPTVINGKVYVGCDDHVTVFGLATGGGGGIS